MGNEAQTSGITPERLTPEELLKRDFERVFGPGNGPDRIRFLLTCLAEFLPGGSGLLGALLGTWSGGDQDHINRLLADMLTVQEGHIREIRKTMAELKAAVDLTDEKVRQRVESPEYQSLLRKAFRDWSASESEQKRKLIRCLLVNAARSRICTDDVIKLFIDWIGKYSEIHFAVIREVHQIPGATRAHIWDKIHGIPVREDSAEADLFKLMIHDLSLGHVMSLEKRVDAYGNILKRPRTLKAASRFAASAFDDEKPYFLTKLGEQFVYYTMNELVPRLTPAPGEKISA